MSLPSRPSHSLPPSLRAVFLLVLAIIHSSSAPALAATDCGQTGRVRGAVSPRQLLAGHKLSSWPHANPTDLGQGQQEGFPAFQMQLEDVKGTAGAIHLALKHVSSRLGIKFQSKEYYRARVASGTRRGYKLAFASNTSFPTASGVPNSFYYVELSFGTPAVVYSLLFDTGSNILWVQCNCGSNCIKDLGYTNSTHEPLHVYKPSASSSSLPLCLHTSSCYPIEHKQKCPNNQQCSFSITYGTGSAFGAKYKDVITLPSSQNTVIKTNFGIGCASDLGTWFPKYLGVDGILGMVFGPGSQSLLYELYKSKLLAGITAFCFDGRNETGSKVRLGAGQIPANMQTTDMFFDSTFSSYVNVSSITVGGKTVVGTRNVGGIHCKSKSKTSCTIKGGILVDTGTSLTLVPQNIYNSLKALLGGPKLFAYNSYIGLECLTKKKALPDIHVEFPTSTWVIPSSTYLFPTVEGSHTYLCLGIAPASGLPVNAIIGEAWIQNNFIQMDFVNGRFGFAPENCTSSNLFQ